MAKARFNKIIRNFSGRLGGMVFTGYGNGQSIVRETRGSVNPHSLAQAAMRSNQSMLVRIWRFLDDAKREKWARASRMTGRDRNPERGKRALIHLPERRLSAFNTFIRTNHLVFSVGRSDVMLEPVLGRFAPSTPKNLTASFDGKNLIVRWDEWIPYQETGSNGAKLSF